MKDEKTTAAPDVGSAVDVEAIMRKYDRESNTRIWEGKPKLIVGGILALFSLFCLYVTLFANFLEQVRLSSFMGLIIVMGFLTYPAHKTHVRVNYIPWYDIVLMIVGAGAFFYYTFTARKLLNMRIAIKLRDPVYIAVGIAGLLVLAELCRRSVGVPILCVAGFFLAYTVFNFIRGGRLLAQIPHELFYGENGVLTTPVNVCSKYIVVFIIFGAFLERTGIADFFINVANSLAGSSAGGPAKVAVISSALCGMVSGSSVGNTVTTGSVTIPMMKRTGYDANFAGAVEAAASTGGQIMPPVMGAAAFLMADYVGVPYSNLIVRAILPAILYFLGIFIAVHLEAKKLGLKGISRDELPKMRKLIKDTYLLLPLLVLVYLVCTNRRTMQFAAAMSIVAAIIVGVISNVVNYVRAQRAAGSGAKAPDVLKAAVGMKGGFGAKNIFDSLEAGAKGSVSVGVACGVAGVICGCITVTGLASKAINFIVGVSGASPMLALVMTMICCIVLGMGVPTTANYCIMASTCAPILIKMGIPTIAAHFFVFYFGIVADITPPVALAAYAGSAIAKGNPMKTGLNATRLAIAAFIIPYVFAFSPSMLFVDTVWYEVLQIGMSSIIGMYGIAAALSRYMFKKMNVLECLLAAGGGLLLIIPGLVSDLCGVGLVGAVIAMQLIGRKKEQAARA
ncbi:MAG: TRAP transporter permease [Clostridiales bacterium]|nr:TRAP transporter permease [Clostridiales bacterium]